jgi:hypothetical protein
MMPLADDFPQAGIYCAPYVSVEPGAMHVARRLFAVLSRGLLTGYFHSAAMGDQIATATPVGVPRAVFDAVGRFSTDRLRADQDMWARIALGYAIAAPCGEPLAFDFRDALGRIFRRRAPDAELANSTRLQQKLDARKVPGPMRDDVALYAEKGLITRVSVNIRAGERATARRFLSDPRIRHFWLRQEIWKALAPLPRPLNFGLAAKEMMLERSVLRPLRKFGLIPWKR